MTRKDYILIAEAIRRARADTKENCPEYGKGLRLASQYLAAQLARDNNRFDCERFIKACGVE